MRPDLILLDLNLAKKTGREVLAEIKADVDLQRIPVVVLTATSSDQDIRGAYNLHANCSVSKPVGVEQLVEVVQAIGEFWLTIVKLPPASNAFALDMKEHGVRPQCGGRPGAEKTRASTLPRSSEKVRRRRRNGMQRISYRAALTAGMGFLGFLIATGSRGQGGSPTDFQGYLYAMDRFLARHPQCVEHGYVSTDALDEQGRAEMRSHVSFQKLVRGDPKLREVALTIDDGPHPYYTERILEILAREHVKATFFVVGKKVVQYPSLVKKEAKVGHELGNHTFSHVRLPTLASADLVEQELRHGAWAIQWAVPRAPTPDFFRPPGGEYNDEVITVAKRHHFPLVLWTDDPGDYTNPGAARIEHHVLRDVRNGGIILLHDGVQQTFDILPDLIQKLKARGYSFVKCAKMARESGAIRVGGRTPTQATHPRGVKYRLKTGCLPGA